MTTYRVPILLAALSVSGISVAGEARTISPESHSLFPETTGLAAAKATQDAASLKPERPMSPEPILVDRTASIGHDGELRYGCNTDGLRDFRVAPHAHTTENER